MPKLAAPVAPAPIERPSQLPALDVPVAVDTETSGLYPDDGARLAVASVAWIPDAILRDEQRLAGAIETGRGVASVAYPFDQGCRDKTDLPRWAIKKYRPEQYDMFATTDPNLDESEWRRLLSWLAEAKGGLVYHNAKFDQSHLRTGTRHWPGADLSAYTAWDTQLVCKDLWPLDTAALKPTAQRLWGYDEGAEARALKGWFGPKDNPRFDLIPWEVIGPYAAKDAELTIRLYWYQRQCVEMGELPAWWVNRERAVMQVLYQMEQRGLPFDGAGCLDAADQIERKRAEIAAGLPFEPSTNEAKRYWFGDRDKGGMGLEPYAVTEKKGEVQLTKDILARMVKDRVPHAEQYAQWRQLDTALDMWYQAYPARVGADGRLRTCFRQTKVVSGRFSVERVNLQAVPHDYQIRQVLPDGVNTIRELVRFPEGTAGWEVDLSQAELRVAAIEAGCDPMLELIADNADLHGETARQLFMVDPDHPEWFRYRQVAKRGNFSLIFGVGWELFRDTVEKYTGISLDPAEARRVVETWNGLYPHYQRAIRRYMQTARRRGYIELVNGRQRWFAPYEDLHKTFNAYVQGSLAELGKDGMIWTERHYPGVLLLTIHDSQVLQCPVGQGEQITAHIAAEWGRMGTEMFGVPMLAEVSHWNEGH